MAISNQNAPSKSPERGTSSCVAPGFNPGRVYETNLGVIIPLSKGSGSIKSKGRPLNCGQTNCERTP